MSIFFKKTRELEAEIDLYLDIIVQGALQFQKGIEYYLNDRNEDFEGSRARLSAMESRADELRREIERKLYLHTLIPDSRGDVLGLLESSDKVLNQLEETLSQFSVEFPDIVPEVRGLFQELADAAVLAVESMVRGVRAYFRDLSAVRDHIGKVNYYEGESDRIAEEIKRIVFRQDLRLSHKFHQRYFALHIESVADEAEDVCDRLAIACIKRDV
jgi:predicted phosphate transport protein (TIGR00153 family)